MTTHLAVAVSMMQAQRSLFKMLSDAVPTLSPSQSLLLHQLGDRVLRVGDLRSAGVHFGTNPIFNLNRLEVLGLLKRTPAKHDRRQVVVSITPRGKKLRERISKTFDDADKVQALPDMPHVVSTLNNLAHVWAGIMR